MTDADLRWGPVETRFGLMGAWVDARGRLTKLWLNLKRALKNELALPRDDKAVSHVVREIAEYAEGKRKDFTIDLAPEGTPFQRSVWGALLKIPYGTTTTYGAIANQLGLPNGARAVGYANGSNPIALIIPCHRVIGSNGSLTGYGGGLPLKRALLAFEAEHAGKDLFSLRSA
ncbi:MAG TPA: methylated-DNA--[protein]-cysteine S-methyltransferase [Rhizomicrobium sp.]|nr:methylated-DNA--[protein]-cysteine S-methyltransferase [Rhizomicrobium sp.]